MVLIGIIATVATPFLSRFILQNSVSTTTEHIVSTLRKAQEYTIAGKNDSAWQASFSGGNLTLVRLSDNTIFDTYAVNPNVSVSGLSTVLYTRPLGQTASAVSITVSGRNSTKTITVNTEGVVSY